MEENNFNELGGTLWVSPVNNMYGRFNVVANGDDYLEGTFMTRAYDSNDLHSTMDVRVQRNSDLNSSVDIKYRNESDLSITLHPTNSSFLEVSLDVRPFNVMYGIFDIIEPPRLTEMKNPSQDATVRSLEEYRYINFGKSSTMMVGKGVEETLYSYIKFDLSSYTDTMTFEKSKLRIHYPSTMEKDILELWTIDRHWEEYGVTYANKPLSSKLLSKTYTIDKDKKYIEFEVLDYIQSIVNDGQENFGLELRGSSGKTYSMFTRETNKAPELISTYFDSRVWNTGRGELEAVLYAYGTGYDDLSATLDVHTDAGYDTLESTLYVHRYDTPVYVELDAMLTVSQPELGVNITVVQTDYDDLDFQLGVRRERQEDSLAFLNVSNPTIDSTVFIKYKEYLNTTLAVRASDNDDLVSTLSVSNPEIDATLFVKYNSELSALLTINVNVEEDVPSYLNVNKPELITTVVSRAYDTSELTAVFGVIGREEELVESMLAVNTPEIQATLLIRQADDSDLSAEISVRVEGDEDVKSFFVISKPELNTTVYIRYYDELESTMLIYQNDICDLVSMLTVSNPELDSTIYVKYYDELNAYIDIQRYDVSEVESHLTVSNPEMNGTILVRYYDDLTAKLAIQRYDDSELESYLTVSQPEMSAVLQPRILEEREFYLNINNPELHSLIITRAYEEDDFDAFLHPKVLGASDISATLGSVNKLRSGAYYYIL